MILSQVVLTFSLALLFVNNITAFQQTNDVRELTPDFHVQKLLDQIHTGVSENAVTNALMNLNAHFGGNLSACFPQIIYYRAEVKRKYTQKQISSADMEKRLMGTYIILREIAPSQDDWKRADWKVDVLTNVVPYIGSDDPFIAEQAQWLLKKMDYAGANKVDFSAYEQLMKNRPEKPEPALIKYMYQKNPQAAVLSMSRVYGDKTAEDDLANQLKGDTKATVQSLVARSEWWVHLYVAMVMKKEPSFRDPEILKKLEKDDHPLVQEAIAEIKSGKSQSN
jgi:hypothetical protein